MWVNQKRDRITIDNNTQALLGGAWTRLYEKESSCQKGTFQRQQQKATTQKGNRKEPPGGEEEIREEPMCLGDAAQHQGGQFLGQRPP